MDRPDPFYVVRDEIVKSLGQAKVEFDAWKHEVVSESTNIKTAETALKETIRNIDWDLEDLQETVQIVERNPSKFRISVEELRSRRHFLQEVKTVVKNVKDQLHHPDELLNGNSRNIYFDVATANKARSAAETGIGGDGGEGGGGFTEDLKWRSEHPGTDAPGLLAEQVALLREQDEHLDQLGSSISRLKQMSHRIGGELGDQVALLDEFSEEMTHTESRLDNAMRRAARLLHIDSSRAQWFVIGILLLTLLVILILFVIL
ncbi:Syntaxin-6 [Echinococcus granulosus]|uniref:Syntaxin 6 n=1 Tax=Echinococcus granulosus TaxID=6210 RepID=A0A068WF15_ECHGR|nr:Syntaxin-6 [Echinococcus granulosus]CDS16212.1 syntaxin 6 [Echinococcus granulosus]